MKAQLLIASTIALTLIGSAIVPKTAIARTFQDSTVQCYFFQGEKLVLEDTCKSDGASWMGGGGHSLKWSDGVVTMIKFGLQGRGTPVCPNREQTSVDGKCGKTYSRSATTLKRATSGDSISCVQLDRKSVCWGTFSH